MTFSFPIKVESKHIRWCSVDKRYELLVTECNKEFFYSLETLIDYMAEQGYWYGGPTDYNRVLFQRFEPKQIHNLSVI